MAAVTLQRQAAACPRRALLRGSHAGAHVFELLTVPYCCWSGVLAPVLISTCDVQDYCCCAVALSPLVCHPTLHMPPGVRLIANLLVPLVAHLGTLNLVVQQ